MLNQIKIMNYLIISKLVDGNVVKSNLYYQTTTKFNSDILKSGRLKSIHHYFVS